MRRTSVLMTIAFLAGLAASFFARSTAKRTFSQRDPHAADLAAIEELHKADVDATLKQDTDLMTNLWSEDGVKVDVPGPPVVGKKAMQELYEKSRAQYPGFKVLKYVNDVKDVQIMDGWAIEVGDSEATYRMSAKDDLVSVPRTRGMRLLKRQTDGSWKFALVGLK